jgi:UDP-3-O-[3-hydroxymyristoyl] glucosamine N-acyltransferase
MSIDPRFYQIVEGVTATELADHIGASATELAKDCPVTGVAAFKVASDGDLTFQTSPKLGEDRTPFSSIVITTPDIGACLASQTNCLIVDNPRQAFARALEVLVIEYGNPTLLADSLVSDTAMVHPHASIAPGVNIGANSSIEAGVVIQAGVMIGANCHIGANSVLSHCRIGDHVIVGSGTVIGDTGFGFELNGDDVTRVPHIGVVRIHNGCGIGSNCAIDRGSLEDTVIESSVMIDNLCHIAHNVYIGQRVIMAGQCGVSGSVTIGCDVHIGGQVGIAQHVSIGEGALLTARSGVTKNVSANMQVAGFPATEAGVFWRERAAIRRLLKPFDKRKRNIVE